jgi:HEAT repeat protein
VADAGARRRHARTPGAVESRDRVVSTLQKHAQSKDLSTRKAAILAMAYLPEQGTENQVIPLLVKTVQNEGEDLDVRLAAATVLGPLGTPDNAEVIDALGFAMRDTDKRNIELVWAAALSLAQLDQPQVADIILQLLDRESLSQFEYYDRETDPQNPQFRKLNEQEQQRILINTMLGARNLDVPEVRQKLKDLAQHDPSPRVREAGIEMLSKANSKVERD